MDCLPWSIHFVSLSDPMLEVSNPLTNTLNYLTHQGLHVTVPFVSNSFTYFTLVSQGCIVALLEYGPQIIFF